MTVNLERVAIVAQGSSCVEMNELFPLLEHFFQGITSSHILTEGSGLSRVEHRLQALPGGDNLTRIYGNKHTWLKHIIFNRQGLLMVAPQEWIGFFAGDLFAGFELWQTVTPGQALTGKYDTQDVQVLPLGSGM